MRWWEATEWGKQKAMEFGKAPKLGKFMVLRVPPANPGEPNAQNPMDKVRIYV